MNSSPTFDVNVEEADNKLNNSTPSNDEQVHNLASSFANSDCAHEAANMNENIIIEEIEDSGNEYHLTANSSKKFSDKFPDYSENSSSLYSPSGETSFATECLTNSSQSTADVIYDSFREGIRHRNFVKLNSDSSATLPSTSLANLSSSTLVQSHSSKSSSATSLQSNVSSSPYTDSSTTHPSSFRSSTYETYEATDTPAIKTANASGNTNDKNFECNICFDDVNDPVVTRCGHLFCWGCLHAWLERGVFECPVCKAGVTQDNVIPLYGRGQQQTDPRSRTDSAPQRPRAERPEPPPPRRPAGIFGGAQFSFGLFPFGIGVSFGSGGTSRTIGSPFNMGPLGPDLQHLRQLTPEQQRAEVASVLMMVIGFLILFYLLFLS